MKLSGSRPRSANDPASAKFQSSPKGTRGADPHPSKDESKDTPIYDEQKSARVECAGAPGTERLEDRYIGWNGLPPSRSRNRGEAQRRTLCRRVVPSLSSMCAARGSTHSQPLLPRSHLQLFRIVSGGTFPRATDGPAARDAQPDTALHHPQHRGQAPPRVCCEWGQYGMGWEGVD